MIQNNGEADYSKLPRIGDEIIANNSVVGQSQIEDRDMKRELYQKNKRSIIIATVVLLFSVLFERFTFVVSVYKTKNHGYVLILAIIFVTVIFNFIN